MFTGTPEEARKREAKAAELAADLARILNAIDELGIGQTMPAPGRIAGPGFELCRSTNNRWIVRT